MNKSILAGFSIALFVGGACGGIPHGGSGGAGGTGGTGAVCDRSDADAGPVYQPLACRCGGDTGWLESASCPASLADAILTVCAYYSPLRTGQPTPPSAIPGLSGCGKVSVGIGINPDGVLGSAAIFDETTSKLVGMFEYSDTSRARSYGDTGFYGTQCDNLVPTCFPCANGGAWTACAATSSE